MRLHVTLRTPALIAAIGCLAAACTDGPPTSVTEASAPNFKPGGGKGKPAGDPPITVTFLDGADYKITSDGAGTYVDGECGVMATFNLEDARLVPDNKKIKPNDAGNCVGGSDPRKVMVAFTDRVEDSPAASQDGNTVGASFFKVNDVQHVTVADETVKRTAVIGGAGCAHQLKFNPEQDLLSSSVDVTNNGDGTWTVATRPSPDNVAVCIPDEDRRNPPPRSYYHMSFSITVTLK